MKNSSFLLTIIILMYAHTLSFSQDWKSFANTKRYEKANKELGLPTPNEKRVVFMGNSITESWSRVSPEYFQKHQYINRGISGQTTPQMLLRFRPDVINIHPKVVVLLAGTNDIAGNTGPTSLETIAENIMSMAELAKQNSIKVIICSVLPARDFPWRSGQKPAPKIVTLNKMLKDYSEKNDIPYIDYYSAMVDEKGGLKVPEFTSADDLVHPNKEGYEVMEELVQKAIEDVLD